MLIFMTDRFFLSTICRTARPSYPHAFSSLRTSLIINVEYNQLDPILRATVSPEGDVNDPDTGLSPFPGNTNNLVFMLDPYLKARTT